MLLQLFNKLLRGLIKFINSSFLKLDSKLEKLTFKDKLSMKLVGTITGDDVSVHASFLFENPKLLDNFNAIKEIFMILSDNELFYLLIVT